MDHCLAKTGSAQRLFNRTRSDAWNGCPGSRRHGRSGRLARKATRRHHAAFDAHRARQQLPGKYQARKRKSLQFVGETVAQDAARVGQRVIDRELDLRPTITVQQRMPFNVLVTKDLELAPYQPVISRR